VALAVSAAKCNDAAAAQLAAAPVCLHLLPSLYLSSTELIFVIQDMNDRANNGAKGDEAAALAQEAVNEFQARQALTAVSSPQYPLSSFLPLL
jgi:hypothetical protein